MCCVRNVVLRIIYCTMHLLETERSAEWTWVDIPPYGLGCSPLNSAPLQEIVTCQVSPMVLMVERGPTLLEILILRGTRFLDIDMKYPDVWMLVSVVGIFLTRTPNDSLLLWSFSLRMWMGSVTGMSYYYSLDCYIMWQKADYLGRPNTITYYQREKAGEGCHKSLLPLRL